MNEHSSNTKTEKFQRSDILISRCTGLYEYGAFKYSNNSQVDPRHVTKKDGPFYCPECLSDAVVRKCTEKKDHFAHKALFTPVLDKKSTLHNRCRDEILSYLQKTFPYGRWASERSIPANKDKGFKEVIPDISGRINNIPIAIEIQLTPYSVEKIYNKIIEYKKRDVAVIWIVPISRRIDNRPFRPRLYEKYLHSLYYGKVYYWIPEHDNRLMPVHFSPAKRWIQESEWFDKEQQTFLSAGGYYLTYKTLKIANEGKPVDLAKDFKAVRRNEFSPKNVRKLIPGCTLYKDVLCDWWEKDEYKNIEKQFTIIKSQDVTGLLDHYVYEDDYDDEFYI